MHCTFDEAANPSRIRAAIEMMENHRRRDVCESRRQGPCLELQYRQCLCGLRQHAEPDLTDAVTLELWFQPETTVWGGGVVGKVMGSYCLSYADRCLFTPQAGQTLGLHPP